jgi:hypothetical protein
MKTCTEMMVNQIRLMKERNWDVLYIAIDLHGTMIPEDITNTDYSKCELYNHAESVLQWMSDNRHIILILHTSTNIEKRFDFMGTMYHQHNVDFSYHNGNPEVQNTDTGDFTEKFYHNVLLDDRAGFDPLNDWRELSENMEMLDDLFGD